MMHRREGFRNAYLRQPLKRSNKGIIIAIIVSAFIIVGGFVGYNELKKGEKEKSTKAGVEEKTETTSTAVPVKIKDLKQTLQEAFKVDDRQNSQVPTVVLGKPIVVGSIKILPKQVELRKVKAALSSGRGPAQIESNDVMLVLYCEVQNISEGEVFVPLTFSRVLACSVEDNFGNTMESVVHLSPTGDYGPHYKIEGYESIEKQIGPAEKLDIAISVEKPKIWERTSDFSWVLHMVTSNKDTASGATVYIKFNKEEVIYGDLRPLRSR